MASPSLPLELVFKIITCAISSEDLDRALDGHDQSFRAYQLSIPNLIGLDRATTHIVAKALRESYETSRVKMRDTIAIMRSEDWDSRHTHAKDAPKCKACDKMWKKRHAQQQVTMFLKDSFLDAQGLLSGGHVRRVDDKMRVICQLCQRVCRCGSYSQRERARRGTSEHGDGSSPSNLR